MIIHKLLRISAIRSQHSLAKNLRIPKHKEILNLTQSRVVEEQNALVHQYSKINLTKKVQVNNFLQSLLRNDFNGAIDTLRSLQSKCNNPATYPEYGIVYISCLTSLLIYILKDSKEAMLQRQINEIASTVSNLPASLSKEFANDITEIQGFTLLLYLNALRGSRDGQRMKMLNTITQFRVLMKKFGITQLELLDLILKHDIDIIEEYKLIFKQVDIGLLDRTISEIQNFLEPSISADKYRNSDGSMSFAGLCDFIKNETFNVRGTNHSKSSKLYEIYEKLNVEEKSSFLREYHAFNKQKQLIIESCSQNLYKYSSTKQQVTKFTQHHNKWMNHWLNVVTLAIQRQSVSDQDMKKYGFIVSYLSAEKVASICLSYIMSSTIPALDVKVMPLVNRISHAIHFELKKLSFFSSTDKIENIFTKEDMKIFVGDIMKIVVDKCKLPQDALLTSMDHVESESESPALFVHELVKDMSDNSKFKYHGVIRMHPFIAENFKCYQELLQSGVYNLPMIVPPKDWLSPTEGGFLSVSTPFVLSSEPKSSEYIMTLANRTGQLNSVYKSLNALGSTPWAINSFIFKAFSKTLRDENLKNLLIPAYTKSAQILKEAKKELETIGPDLSVPKFVTTKQKKKILGIERDRQNLDQYYSLVNTFARSLSENGELFYLPHQLDFRGRVYPSVSFLSQHSEDFIRSLLMFWEAKELGSDGFDWLKYQLSSMYNKSKLNMLDLLLFIEQNKYEILDSAKDPFGGNMWWSKGNNPWQSLALCKELTSVWEFNGDVSKYKSRIPIHQDGTCNGLQHYSALSGEIKAAESVNVLPSNKRQDVYLTVLSAVKLRISQEQMAGGEDSELAKLVLPVLNRKLIKQTVMTTVYGVTLFGATKQIKNQMEDFLVSNPSIDVNDYLKKNLSRSAAYIARHVLLSINELFNGAQLIQKWLVENCIRSIQSFNSDEISKPDFDFFSTKHYQPFMWTSLSGFPVVQYYRKTPKGAIFSNLQSFKVRKLDKIAPIDEQKLINAVAPNFIHSIDAIHLLMTSIAAQERKITFAAVHDCFWTHPSDVSTLSTLIREEFIRLHKSDVMENMRNDLMYVNRNNYQLVWVSLSSNKEFVKELENVRNAYPIAKIGGSKIKLQNQKLKYEVSNAPGVQALINKYKPQLLYQARASHNPIVYEGVCRKEVAEKISMKTHIPLAVPVKILDLPPLGTLDLDLVKASVFFFS